MTGTRRRGRRAVLRAAGAFAAGRLAVPAVAGRASTTDARRGAADAAIPTTDAAIREAFADVPRVDDPERVDRLVAKATFPDVVVGDGSVPDTFAGHDEIEVETPPWVLAAVYDRFEGTNPSRDAVADALLELCQRHERHVLPDGRGAVDVLLGALHGGE